MAELIETFEVKKFDMDEYDWLDKKYKVKTSTRELMDYTYGYLKPIKMVKIERYRNPNGSTKVYRYFECHCNRCGGTCIVKDRVFKESTKKSCGCLEKENKEKLWTHSKSWTAHTDDITGQKFDILTAKYMVTDPADPNYGKWYFECECGGHYYATRSELTKRKHRHPNTILSCGCMTKHLQSETHKIHGDYKERLYYLHSAMIARCYNKNHKKYPIYGGRGIYICDEWYTPGSSYGYINFKKWAYGNGYYDQPEGTSRAEILTIDRIDNNGPYAPWNCRWVTTKVQLNNTSVNRHVKYNGQVYTFAQFRELFGVDQQVYMHEYVNKGKSLNLMVYNFIHWKEPEKRLYYDPKRGVYVDREGFIHMLPKYDIELLD